MWENNVRPLTVLPTGYGKTLLMGAMAYAVDREYSQGTVIICGSQELAVQTTLKLKEFFPRMTIGYNFSGSRLQDKNADIIVTLPLSLKNINPENTGLVLFDEAHHAVADTWYETLDELEAEGVFIGGMTATPIRSDGQSLTRIFDGLSINMHLSEAEHEGFLIKPKLHYHRVEDGDKSAMFKTALDYTGKAGKVLVFCDGIQHAEDCHRFVEREHGEDLSVVLHSKMSARARDVSLSKFAEGGPARICFQDDILREGYDNAEVTTVVIMRNVKSTLPLTQMIGRVTRPAAMPEGDTPEERRDWIRGSGKSETHVVYFSQDIAEYVEPLLEDILKPWEELKEGAGTYQEFSKIRETDEWRLNYDALVQMFEERDLYNNELIKLHLVEIGSVEDLIARIADRVTSMGGLYNMIDKREILREAQRYEAEMKRAVDLILSKMPKDRIREVFGCV
jgi:superfamily II DNA or RNA helicase